MKSSEPQSACIIDVIIPVFNEAGSIGLVVKDIPKEKVRNIIVCDNGSTDETASVAMSEGAVVIHENRKGYGYACLAGIDYTKKLTIKPDILVFMDGDYSDYPEELVPLVQPIIEGNSDFVIGSRALGVRERGSMTPQQIFGNWLATNLIRIFFHYRFTDLGPFRAISYEKLLALHMKDKTFGWTVEMQIKAAKQKLICKEIPVSYRKRIGISKVSGTIKGTLMAGYKIIWTILKYL